MIGIIGGSGLYQIEGVTIKREKRVKTPFGSPSDAYLMGEFSGRNVIFLPRHGKRHSIAPHRINYRANIWGFRELGVTRIISIGATGGIHSALSPGNLVVLDQVIDMTAGRNSTFWEGDTGVYHVDFTEPYCEALRKVILTAGKKTKISVKKSGTYVCTNGPRLETRAEIRFFSRAGADVVGMTAMPEAALAREAEMCYAGIAVVTNFAPGVREKKLTATEVVETMQKASGRLRTLLKETFRLVPSARKCSCKEALREAKV